MSPPRRLEILDSRPTPIGELCLRRRELLSSPGTIVTEVTLDGEFLMSSFHTESERALASRTLARHEGAGPLDVLVGGLGLGYTAAAALEDERVARVEVVELLPEVIAWLEAGLIPLAETLRGEARLAVVEGDVFRRLAGDATAPYDAILLDVDHSPDELLAPANRAFYTPEGLERAREHLAEGGILAVWSSGESAAFTRDLERVFSEVTVEIVEWRNDLIDEDVRDVIFLARR